MMVNSPILQKSLGFLHSISKISNSREFGMELNKAKLIMKTSGKKKKKLALMITSTCFVLLLLQSLVMVEPLADCFDCESYKDKDDGDAASLSSPAPVRMVISPELTDDNNLIKLASNTEGYRCTNTSVNMMDNSEKFMKVPEVWTPPETKPYNPVENLKKWLPEEKQRDQFLIRASTDTDVLWDNARQLKPDMGDHSKGNLSRNLDSSRNSIGNSTPRDRGKNKNQRNRGRAQQRDRRKMKSSHSDKARASNGGMSVAGQPRRVLEEGRLRYGTVSNSHWALIYGGVVWVWTSLVVIWGVIGHLHTRDEQLTGVPETQVDEAISSTGRSFYLYGVMSSAVGLFVLLIYVLGKKYCKK